MEPCSFCITRWLVTVIFVFWFRDIVVQTKMTFPLKLNIACQMVKKLLSTCDGRFLHIITTTCEDFHNLRSEVSTRNNSCRRNGECSFHSSVCYDGVCLCRLGLYFSPKQNICLRKCPKYDADMDFYNRAGIAGHNTRITHHVSLARCHEKCSLEKNFTCLTIDWKRTDGSCYLSKYGYLDVYPLFRESNMADWIFAQRRCK